MWPVVAQVGVSLIGELMAQGREREAKELMERALARFGNIEEPSLREVAAEVLPQSDLGAVEADPQLKDAQFATLEQLQNIQNSGGMTLQDRATDARVQGGIARNTNAANQRVLESMAARGMGGSGAELAAQLSNNQAGAEVASQQGMDSAAAAQSRYFDAILKRGQMAGQMRGQGFDEDAKTAEARDLRNRYNASARERATMYNANLPQQRFENSLRKTGAQAGMDSSLAGMSAASAAGQRSAGAAFGAAAYKGLKAKDKDEK